MRICLLGFGEVGQTLADDLRGQDVTAWDLQFADPDSGPSRARIERQIAAQQGDFAELVISAVTAAQDVAAAEALAPHLTRGTWFVDFNSASPEMKKRCAQIVEAAGGRYVESAVMAPIAPKRIATSMLLGGPHAAEFLAVAQALGMSGAKFFSAVTGQASAAKMCRSVMIKGIESLLTESMITARHYGVEQTVLNSLSDLLPIGDWPKLAQYMISRSLEHGVRRAEEMREVAVTVREAGIEPLMSAACAQRQDWSAARRQALEAGSLPDMLDRLLELRK